MRVAAEGRSRAWWSGWLVLTLAASATAGPGVEPNPSILPPLWEPIAARVLETSVCFHVDERLSADDWMEPIVNASGALAQGDRQTAGILLDRVEGALVEWELSGDQCRNVVRPWTVVSSLYRQAHRRPEALATARRAVELLRSRTGELGGWLYFALLELSAAHSVAEQYLPALRALDAAGELGIRVDPVLAYRYQLKRARLLVMVGRYGEALPLAEELAKSEEDSTLELLGRLRMMLGDTEAAYAIQERRLELLDATRPSFTCLRSGLFGTLAILDVDRGDYGRALKRTLESLAAEGCSRGAAAWVWHTRGRALSALGHYDAAIECYERALELRQQLRPEGHSTTARTHNNLGLVYYELGELDFARDHLERAVELFRRTRGDHPVTASGLHSLALVYDVGGDPIAAENHYREALALLASIPRHPSRVPILSDLARLLLCSGRPSEAFQLAEEAEELQRWRLGLLAEQSSEAHALRYHDQRAPALDILLAAAARSGDGELVQRAFDQWIRSRGLIADRLAARHRASAHSKDPEAARWWAELRASASSYAALLSYGREGLSAEEHVVEVDRAAQRYERAQRELAARVEVMARELSLAQVGLPELSDGLAAGTVLVSYATYPRVPSRTLESSPVRASCPGELGDAGSQLVAFILEAGETAPQWVPLGAVDDVARQLRTHRDAIRLQAETRSSGMSLYSSVWEPLVPSIADAEAAVVVRGDLLSGVNLYTLRDGDGTELLFVGPTIAYQSVERDLVRELRIRHDGAGLLALGAPEFGSSDADLDEGAGLEGPYGPFPPLPAALDEVLQVARSWWEGGGEGPVHVLTGTDATESAFERLSVGRRVLHLSTHTLGEVAAGGGLDGTPVAHRPSGLALTWANRARDGTGILTDIEIGAADLTCVELVVLAACSSALGRSHPGEGLLGLERSFRLAGAGAVVASLWQVEDAATAAWMAAFYTALLERDESIPQAVRSASLDLRRTPGFVQPRFWGAFVSLGGRSTTNGIDRSGSSVSDSGPRVSR